MAGSCLAGLRAVFGEQYPDPVRVVSIGRSVEDLLANPSDPENRKYSIEFCGGTHLPTTGQARAFALLSEEGIAKVSHCMHAASANYETLLRILPVLLPPAMSYLRLHHVMQKFLFPERLCCCAGHPASGGGDICRG